MRMRGLMKSILLAFILAPLATMAAPSRFELQDNRIIIQVFINQNGPYHMMLDTGATNILSNAVATQLHLNQYDSFLVAGGGTNKVTASYCDVSRLEVSDQVMRDNRFICMDLTNMQNAIGFPKLDGLIGYEVFSQFLTEVNFDKMQIRLMSFSERKNLKPGATTVPLTFDGVSPLVQGVLDGIPGNFILDTGDRASSTLSLPFVTQYSLQQKYPSLFSMMTGYGIGGPMITSVAIANELTIGGLVFSQTLIRLPTMQSQALNIPGIAGTIGTGLLRQFNILFDYSRKEMVLSKNSSFEQDRRFDRSGMWLTKEVSGFKVFSVLEDGPAWNAGIREGQILTVVNGIAAEKINLFDLREQLKDPKQKEISLKVSDGARVFEAKIQLQNLLAAAP